MIHRRKNFLIGALVAMLIVSATAAAHAATRQISILPESDVPITASYRQNGVTVQVQPQTENESSVPPGGITEEGSSLPSDYYINSAPHIPMMNFDYYGSPFFGVFGLIMMILWWVVIIWAVVAFIRWLDGVCPQHGSHRGNHGGDHSALETLRTRYAKGEIDRREFEEKKTDLI